ncbi:40S ribosomal protein S5-1 [Hordeum vulgare]|nr:40S ribosomal protein S5-1 [Hordeum vulgare]
MDTKLEAMEQQVFKCQGMVEHGLNANHMMITEYTSNHKMDAIEIGKHLSTLYDRVDQLQGQIYDLQNQNCLYTAFSRWLTSCPLLGGQKKSMVIDFDRIMRSPPPINFCCLLGALPCVGITVRSLL